METLNNEEPNIVVNQEAIKLTLNAKGNYQWEIRIFPKDMNDEDWIKRIEKLNLELQKRYKTGGD